MGRPVASPERLEAMDVKRNCIAIQNGDYLCMLDVQNFIYVT